jgi:hypothetical protein
LNAEFSNGQSPLLFQLIDAAQIGLARSPGIETWIKKVLASRRRKALRRSHFTLLLRQVICPTGSVREFLSSPRVKNKSLFNSPNQWLHCAIPSRYEGRFAIVTNVGMGCGGRGSVARETGSQGGFSRERSANARRRAMLKRTAKACGPGTRCWCQVGEGLSKAQPGAEDHQFAGDGGKTNSSPGRSRISRKSIAWGMPDDSGASAVNTGAHT